MMTTGQAIRLGALAAVVLMVAACGAPAASGGTPTVTPAAATQPGESVGTEPSPSAEPGESTGGGAGGDVEAVAKALVPPNSTESSKTTAEGVVFAMYESTDSIESLKAFYESAIPQTGMKIFSTTSSNGGFAWTIASDDTGSFGGAVSIFPAGGKSAVQITVGSSN